MLESNGAILEYHVIGDGDEILLIHSAITADGPVRPLLREPAFADSYRVITYNRPGYQGSAVGTSPLTMADQAARAAALLDNLTVRQALVVGHSFGALVALQLVRDRPDLVRSLALREPPLMGVPDAAELRDDVLMPAAARYRAGDTSGALDLFLGWVFGPDWREALAQAIPDGVAAAEAAVDTFFTVDMPAVQGWSLDRGTTAAVTQPVLSVVGSQSQAFYRQGRSLLHQWFPQTEDVEIPDANHLLQMRNPAAVAGALRSFFDRVPAPSEATTR